MAGHKKSQLNKTSQKQSHANDSSRNAQNERLAAHLRFEQADTFTIMRELNICRPGARVCDLRNSGYEIITTRKVLTDEWGRIHRGVAIYTLISEPSPQVET